MTRTHLLLASATVIVFLSLPASRCAAQAPPFFGAGGGIFDPEISTVQSGVLLDATAVVSADRKYVTMTTRFQLADLLALREFAFQTGGAPGGQVGGAGAQGVGRAGGAAVGNVNGAGADGGGAASGGMRGAPRGASGRGAAAQYPAARKPYPKPGETTVAPSEPILERPGMTLVGRVQFGPASRGELSRS
jgi:hypothetical protein